MADGDDDTGWDNYFAKAAPATDTGEGAPGWETHFTGVAGQPPQPPAASQPMTPLRELAQAGKGVLIGGEGLAGLPGLAETAYNALTPSKYNIPDKFVLPTAEEIDKKLGRYSARSANVGPLAPQNWQERYLTAGGEALPNALALAVTGGSAALPALATSLGGTMAAQGATDLFPGNRWAPVIAGVVGSLGAGGTASLVDRVLENRQALKLLGSAQNELDDAVQAAAEDKNPASKNALAVKDSNVLEGYQAQNVATGIQRASQANLDAVKTLADETVQKVGEQTGQVFENTAGLLGKSKTVEDAGKILQTEARKWLSTTMPAKLKAVSEPLDAAVAGETSVPLDNFTHALQSINKKAGSLQGVADEMAEGLPARLLKALEKRSGEPVSNPDLGGLVEPSAASAPTWAETRVLRTMLGDAMKDPTAVKGISQQNLAYLYKSLTTDLGAAAKQAGAGDLWNAYNTESSRLYGLAGGVMSKLTSTGKESLAPGKVASSLLRDGAKDSGDLAALRAELPVGADELAAANLRSGPDAWGKLSPASRQALVPATDTTSAGVLDSAVAVQEQAATNAKQTVAAATKSHAATVQQAQDDLKAGNFSRSQALRDAQRAEAQASYDANQNIAGLKAKVAELKSRVPKDASPSENLASTIKRWGTAALGYGEAPALLHALGVSAGPVGRATVALGTLAAKPIWEGIKNLATHPSSALVPASGALAGQNALALQPRNQ